MKQRRRPKATVYLGNEVYARLENFRRQFAHPPSTSSIVREAVERYLAEMEAEQGHLPPSTWVAATEAHVMWLREREVAVDSEELLHLLRAGEDERVGTLAEDEEI